MLPDGDSYWKTPFWKAGFFRLFISHVSKYKRKAKDLEHELEKYHISSFVAHVSIEPMEEWEDIILHALASSDALVALLHNGFHESNWTDQEIGIAIGRRVLVIPIMLGKAPYGFLGKYQAILGRGKSNEELGKEIYNILSTNYPTKSKIENTLIDLLINSKSQSEALHNIALVESIKYPNKEQYYLLEKALKNIYVMQSLQIKKRLDALLARFREATREPFLPM